MGPRVTKAHIEGHLPRAQRSVALTPE